MELAEKRNLIRDNKEIVLESINTTLDSLYNLLAPVQNEDGSVDEKMFKNDEAKNFAVNLLKDTEQYEHVRTKISIKVGDGIAVKETLYIEDTDIDQDCLPDIYEYDAASGKGDFLAAKGPAANGYDGYIAVNTNLVTDIKRLNASGAVTYMLSAGMLSMPSDLVALSLGIDTAENTVEESTLAIKSISLVEGAVNLTVGAKANEPDLGTLFVKDSTVTATIVVKYADSLDGEWMSTEVTKTFIINEGGVSDELSFSLSELGLDHSKGFFKVELK